MQEIHTNSSLLWPNLYLIGAMKSGSTSLHEYLNRHPAIFLSEPKEPGYFSALADYYPKSTEWYLSLFEGASGATWRGESSTHYTKRPREEGIADRIYEKSPSARLLYIVREPISRLVSHYWHNTRWDGEWRDFRSAIDTNEEYKSFSDYQMQIEPFVNAFGRDAIKVVVFEEMKADPEKIVHSVLDWLGLPSMPWPSEPGVFNQSPEIIDRARFGGLLYKIRHSRPYGVLANWIPKRWRTAAAGISSTSVRRQDPLDPDVYMQLMDYFDQRIVAFEKTLGRPLDQWRELQRAKLGHLRRSHGR